MVMKITGELPHDRMLRMGVLSLGGEGAADLEESVMNGIVQFHFADVFALEDNLNVMVSTGVKRNTTVAACGEKGWGQDHPAVTRQPVKFSVFSNPV